MSNSYTPKRPGRSQFVSLRGLKHHLNVWGDAAMATPERAPLLLMHGWMDVGASFQFTVDAMAPQRYIVAADWRGFGLSDPTPSDCYWFADYLGDLDALIDFLSPDAPIDLVGHSMGGNIVMSYAGVRPQRVRRLVNMEGYGVPNAEPHQAPQRLEQWLDELKKPQRLRSFDSIDGVAKQLMKTNPRLPEDKAAWLATHWSRRGEDGRWTILGDAAHKIVNPVLTRADDVIATWGRISAPLLWVEGDGKDFEGWYHGRYTRVQFEQRLAEVPRVERLKLTPAGHMLHHDQPEALARALEAFLDAA
ncbi:MAG: Hydrolase [Proteobacteria bacterium]|nr:Hydrolase [Pseudomonadota bacterium]